MSCKVQVPQHVFELYDENSSDILIGSWLFMIGRRQQDKNYSISTKLMIFRSLCCHLDVTMACSNVLAQVHQLLLFE